MSNAINWAKSNIVIVISCLVIVLGIAAYAVPIRGMGASLTEEMKEPENKRKQVGQLMRGVVQAPAAQVGGNPIELQRPLNVGSVRQLEHIMDEMNSGYRKLYDAVVQFNKSGHKPLVDGLFPTPVVDVRRNSAHEEYARALYNTEGQPGLYQLLGGNTAPTSTEVEEQRALAQQQYMAARDATSLLPAEQEEMAKAQALAHRDLIINRAVDTRVYAQPPHFVGKQLMEGQPGIFDIGDWAKLTALPSIEDLWEAQMGLWIQQDLVRAINLANEMSTDDPNPNVTQVAVKRVVAMQVMSGYVGAGLNRESSMMNSDGTTTTTVAEPDLTADLAPNFGVSPTGRTCNALYDVRMAKLIVYVDIKQLPLLLDAIVKVNFMTPIVKSITDVDEYQDFLTGSRFYGQNVDVVQVELDIETLWMRRWTYGNSLKTATEDFKRLQPTNVQQLEGLASDAQKLDYLKQAGVYDPGLMPDAVRYNLNLPTRDPNFKPVGADNRNQGMGPNFDPMMPQENFDQNMMR